MFSVLWGFLLILIYKVFRIEYPWKHFSYRKQTKKNSWQKHKQDEQTNNITKRIIYVMVTSWMARDSVSPQSLFILDENDRKRITVKKLRHEKKNKGSCWTMIIIGLGGDQKIVKLSTGTLLGRRSCRWLKEIPSNRTRSGYFFF